MIHYHRFVMKLLHWHIVCEHGGDKLYRPPVVALMGINLECIMLTRGPNLFFKYFDFIYWLGLFYPLRVPDFFGS